MSSRRQFFRRKLRVEIDHFDLEDVYQMHFSRDLSRGGVFIETDDPLPLGSRFQMHFEIPEHGEIETEGEVAWMLRLQDSSADLPPGMGVRFVDLSEKDGEVIDAFLRSEKD